MAASGDPCTEITPLTDACKLLRLGGASAHQASPQMETYHPETSRYSNVRSRLLFASDISLDDWGIYEVGATTSSIFKFSCLKVGTYANANVDAGNAYV